MAMSDRTRAKGTQSAQALLPPGTVVRDYVIGRANPRLATGAIVALSIFGCAFLVALAFGTILVPGGLLLIYVIHAVRPPRPVVVADQGIAVFEKSFLNGRPTKALAMLPASVWPDIGSTGQAVTLDAGPERVSFSRREAERLRAALAQPHPVLSAL
jgi:hypothetical protein